MTEHNKLVIRRLPPTLTEEQFLNETYPLPAHDYFCFFEANPNLGAHSYSRVYINFLNPDDMSSFREKYDNHIFKGKDGHEYPAVVEQSMWHHSPKSGPFYKPDKMVQTNSGDLATTSSSKNLSKERTTNSIEQDPKFREFVERLHNQRR